MNLLRKSESLKELLTALGLTCTAELTVDVTRDALTCIACRADCGCDQECSLLHVTRNALTCIMGLTVDVARSPEMVNTDTDQKGNDKWRRQIMLDCVLRMDMSLCAFHKTEGEEEVRRQSEALLQNKRREDSGKNFMK